MGKRILHTANILSAVLAPCCLGLDDPVVNLTSALRDFTLPVGE
jgi:hypothetical protein